MAPEMDPEKTATGFAQVLHWFCTMELTYSGRPITLYPQRRILSPAELRQKHDRPRSLPLLLALSTVAQGIPFLWSVVQEHPGVDPSLDPVQPDRPVDWVNLEILPPVTAVKPVAAPEMQGMERAIEPAIAPRNAASSTSEGSMSRPSVPNSAPSSAPSAPGSRASATAPSLSATADSVTVADSQPIVNPPIQNPTSPGGRSTPRSQSPVATPQTDRASALANSGSTAAAKGTPGSGSASLGSSGTQSVMGSGDRGGSGGNGGTGTGSGSRSGTRPLSPSAPPESVMPQQPWPFAPAVSTTAAAPSRSLPAPERFAPSAATPSAATPSAATSSAATSSAATSSVGTPSTGPKSTGTPKASATGSVGSVAAGSVAAGSGLAGSGLGGSATGATAIASGARPSSGSSGSAAATGPSPAAPRATAAPTAGTPTSSTSRAKPAQTTSTVDLRPYLQQVKRQVDQRWVSRDQGNSQVMVQFRIGRSGDLQAVSLARPSGNAQADAAALIAVRTAAPYFGPLPQGYGNDSIRVELTLIQD
ncbi:hypothetical protein PROH_18395 [Prochlorothrix hollandica PCC 9006 = CALU 1027]|uniref:TonB C-terminal domain-containing protein n=2 Tax=Prochlorothrix hollandica TaxID=1223 RepID=A0A0M2PUW1_PROHO|nr:hypothetical protein PROH_18395 [Prochlorothrix hollandica PCC 9006 = CALU 1027]